jgi:hypothetical protein
MDISQALTIAIEGYNDSERPIERSRFAKIIETLSRSTRDAWESGQLKSGKTPYRGDALKAIDHTWTPGL